MSEDVPPASATDGDLISSAQAGNSEAFGELYRRYLPQIYGYIRLRVDTERDAEDLAETVFLRSFQAIQRYEDRGVPFTAFLYKVARHAVVDSYRSRSSSLPLEEAEKQPDDAPGAESSLMDLEQKAEALAALGRLPERYQEVIRLRVLLDVPTEKVALWMGSTPTAVRVLLHRALKALRKSLGTDDEAA
jgi:RNA polymerase sigma-70 factor (ECF subfamily)